MKNTLKPESVAPKLNKGEERAHTNHLNQLLVTCLINEKVSMQILKPAGTKQIRF
jgi:hypothetical protein